MNECCEKCRFFRHPGMAPNPGECHRRAPAIQNNRYWPAVNRDDWCGEFEAVAVEEKPANPCVECGKGTEPELGYVPFYSGGGELKFIHQTCADERFKR